MIGNKKIIGVCLTKINNRARADYISHLHTEAIGNGYKLMVFNSVKDFYNGDDYDEGAKSIYSVINYNIIDALIILSDNFCRNEEVTEIIETAKAQNVPVILIGDKVDGCYCIVRKYQEAYKQVIRHVICDHGVTDTYFVAGLQEDDEESQLRIQCYKEVLEENGLPFDDKNIGYGGYWSAPAKALIEELLQSGRKLPQAFICANDSMAITVCETLKEHGYRVPEDVIVTGFDGLPDGEYLYPKLTTCKEDNSQLAKLCVNVITDILNNTVSDSVFVDQYTPSINQSCGCHLNDRQYLDDINYLFRMNQDLEHHEAHMYSWFDRLIESPNISKMNSILAQSILADSCICLNPDLINSISRFNESQESTGLPSELMVISANDDFRLRPDELPAMQLADMVPDLDSWLEDDSSYVLTSLFVGNKVCGYYAVKLTELFSSAHKVNRIAKIINTAFNSIINQLTQKFMRLSIENAAHTNPITHLPNLKGAESWFEDFASIARNHDRVLVVSMYALPKYKYIYENYGVKDIEEAICTVADTLQLANPAECFIAHVSEDSFILINYLDDPNDVAEVINNATSVFFTNLENYNSENGKEYYVEVNCGCTVINPGWKNSLASYTKLASNEMYLNRIKSGEGAIIKEKGDVQDFYNEFSILLEMNLFDYHFQPIIDAKTGEIYAYEALMRPDSSLGMNPLQVLETASLYKRLYDIEKATIFNVMERFSRDFEQFEGRKVFINSIPGYFLNDADNKIVSDRYSDYMKYVVFEITEQNSISDEELAAIKRVGNVQADNHIAIDDYGTGHSNIVNLMRYTPQIIKIDRFLISNIHKDVNKQMFVKSTIDFARLNNIQVLAEGVETSEELRTVIEFGVDYVQGYYTGRPASNPIANIAPEIKEEIIRSNLQNSDAIA